METIDFKQVWKNSQPEFKIYSSKEIQEITTKRDNNIFKNIVKHTRVNFLIKMIISLGIVLLFLMFKLPNELLMFNLALFFIAILLSTYDMSFAREVSNIKESSDNLVSNLSRLKRFFNSNYSNYKILSAFSNPLIVAVGVESYALRVHGEFKLTDTDDIVVFLLLILLSYAFAIYANSRISKDISAEIESSFIEIEDEREMTSFLIGEEKRKKKLKRFYLSLIIIGLITFVIAVLFHFFN